MKQTKRKFNSEFKRQAVELTMRGDKTLTQVANDLGVSVNTLSRWKQQLLADPVNAFPGKGYQKPEDAELSRLKKELRDVTEERDILKKALAIFSKQPKQSGNS